MFGLMPLEDDFYLGRSFTCKVILNRAVGRGGGSGVRTTPPVPFFGKILLTC